MLSHSMCLCVCVYLWMAECMSVLFLGAKSTFWCNLSHCISDWHWSTQKYATVKAVKRYKETVCSRRPTFLHNVVETLYRGMIWHFGIFDLHVGQIRG